MVVFIISCIIYLLCALGVLYWTFIEDAEDFFPHSLICITTMALISLSILSIKTDLLSISVLQWISAIAAAVAIIFTIIYILGYLLLSVNDFEAPLLLFLLPMLISGATIALAFFWDFDISDYRATILSFIGLLCTLIVIIVEIKHKIDYSLSLSRQRMLERKLHENLTQMDDISRKRYNDREISRIERVLCKLYMSMKEGKISPAKAMDILHSEDISLELIHKVMDRLFLDDYVSRISFLNLSDFLQDMLPEIFVPRRTYHSSSMDIRYYEDLYERIRNSINAENNRVVDELIRKIDSMHSDIEKNLQIDTRNNTSSETYGTQNQIRELFHALETPIATSEMALATLKASFGVLSELQENKFNSIQSAMKLIKSILFAYRELTFMNIYKNDNKFFSLPEIINSIPSLMSEEVINIPLVQRNIPDQIPKYSTNLIVVLLLPLVQNAIEASPKNKSVLIEYLKEEKSHTIKIENFCRQTPRQVNLDTEGYSSKGNEHIGTGISIVRRISKTVDVKFELKVTDNKVCSTLSFPMKQ